MSILNLFTMCGGLAFFLYGMNVMSNGLERLSGGKLESILRNATSNPFKSLLLGAGITIARQSSSAMTVMLVGLVNSGIMQLSQTVGVIMGSNIGTTLTAWILASAGIESDNIFISLLKPSSFSPVLALIGIGFIMMAKSDKKKNLGSIFVGFAVLMYGMELMQDSVSPLADSPEFSEILTAFKNPIIGVLVGAVFTGIIQSSAASVGILQSLSMNGLITYSMAIPIIMGQNIGTCVTALISSIGVNRNARRVSVVHISFNIIGTVVFMAAFYGADAIFKFAFTDQIITPFMIAVFHSIFNAATTLLLLPFSKMLVRIAEKVVPVKESTEEYAFLDERLLNTPSFAVTECINLTVKMAKTAKKTICDVLDILWEFDQKKSDEINENEDSLDVFEDKLGSFLVKISTKDISTADSNKVSMMLHTIGDFERIGDHALNLVRTAKEIDEKKVEFSKEAQKQMDVAVSALKEILEITFTAFVENDIEKAKNVEPLEQVIDGIAAKIKTDHVSRLQKGDCTIEYGFILSDILNNIERVSDHCSNIAVALIEVSQNSFDTHQYLNAVKIMDNENFKEKFLDYSDKFAL
ncbi:MAG: Na/Pi cotransporter family protein [Oscillospiraceae bacterium]|nr:Na/Pi cotransporter family protein [Oscillospiraceae bacterium]